DTAPGSGRPDRRARRVRRCRDRLTAARPRRPTDRAWLAQSYGGTGLRVVQRRVGVVDVKPSPLGWPAVGVDADDRIGVQGIGHRGALVHARPQSVVVASGRAVRTPNWLNRPR